jgi:hypothetical protein
MCCFSNAPAFDKVTGTQIFARPSKAGRQLLVYSMTVHARDTLAMILPLPVPPRPKEDAVRFINLEGYPRFFDDMNKGFPEPMRQSRDTATFAAPAACGPLVVHDVDDFEASFVPTLTDFDRLEPRFSIRRVIWDQIPDYHDYGVAVFKLKSFGQRRSLLQRMVSAQPKTEKKIHPMALSFPTREPKNLFFPTVHIHDGSVHETALFDHTLYCHFLGVEQRPQDW